VAVLILLAAVATALALTGFRQRDVPGPTGRVPHPRRVGK
jgi:hypothetical protein